MNIAILISGRGSNMLALIEAVRTGRIPDSKIVIVISDRADAAGVARARERGIETRVVERRKLRAATPAEKNSDRERARFEHEQAIIAELKARDVELICLAGFMRLLSPQFIETFRNQIVNIHPSLLPAFPGLHAQRQALEYGVKFTGCTVHFVDETLDGGAIITQRVVPVYDTDSEASLAQRILKEEHAAYVEAVAQIARGAIEIIGRRVKHKNL